MPQNSASDVSYKKIPWMIFRVLPIFDVTLYVILTYS